MKPFRHIRDPRSFSLLWRVGVANFAVLALIFGLFIVTPITIHAPVQLTEALVLAGGLIVMFFVDLALVRRALAPLDELALEMEQVDLHDPSPSLSRPLGYGPVLTSLVGTFDAMLDRLTEERRAGARAALAAQERERLRIGQALHDEAGQTLTAVALEVERVAADSPPGQRERMEALASQLHSSLDDIRRIARDLRPEALDDLGLVNALIALTSRLDRQGELRVERRFAKDLPPLSAELELVIYRVAQEALTNVLRHAEARTCVVELRAAAGRIELDVSDDGSGIGRIAPHDTIGIEGMRERALLAGGTLTIDSTPERGTRVTLSVPVEA